MKNKIWILIFSSVVLVTLLGNNSLENTGANKLKVHEWGTFTTLLSSKGKMLSGLYIEEEKLPQFVYQHKLPATIHDKLKRQKGVFVEPLNVTVKMETPVIYFYSPQSRKVSVRVDYPRGSISQWYPKRSNGELLSTNNITDINFENDYNGWIEWDNIEILPQNSTQQLSPPKNKETETWVTPRATDANKLSVNGEVEKFLFYRGLGNFSIPIKMQFDDNKKFKIENSGSQTIPYVFVYEKKEDGNENIWWTGSLEKGETKEIPLSSGSTVNTASNFNEFEKALIKQGLYKKEAKSMLETWKTSYFKKPGFRVFWVLPKDLINEMLPLKIEPMPAEINRVFVGRCDLLTPEFESKLKKQSEENFLEDYKDHRYYLSFLEWIKETNQN